MPYDEYVNWQLYFQQRPIGWREDDRTYKLLRAQGVTASETAIFPSLAVMKEGLEKEKRKEKEKEVNVKSLKNSIFFHKMLSSRGGDKLVDDQIRSKTP